MSTHVSGITGTAPDAPYRLHRWMALALALVTFAIFSAALRSEFVRWDDDINIERNRHIQGLNAENLRWMFTDVQQALRYKPLSWLSWSLIYEVSGLRPFGYHLLNLIFHSANAGLVFLLLRKLAGICGGPPDGRAAGLTAAGLGCCAFGALLWSLHPLRVEPVAWATGLPYGQSLFFLLLSLLAYVESVTAAHAAQAQRRFRWMSLAAFTLALLSYPIVLSYAALLVCLDAYPLRRLKLEGATPWRTLGVKVLREKLPFFVITLALGALTLAGRYQAGWIWSQPVKLEEFGVFPRAMQAFYIWAYFLWKSCAPFELSPLYLTLVSFDPWAPAFVASSVLVLAVSLLVGIKRQSWPAAWPLWAGYLVLLAPMLGLTEHPHYPSDRYSYAVSVLWAGVVCGVSWRWWHHRPAGPLIRIGAIGLLAGLAALSCRQVAIWRDSETLFQYMITKLENKPERRGIYHRLGNFYMSRDQYGKAVTAFAEALAIEPNAAETLSQQGLALVLAERPDEAVTVFEKLVRADPRYPKARINLARACAEAGQYAKAATNFALAVAAEPNNPRVHLAFAGAKIARGDRAGGILSLLKAKALDPTLESVYLKLAQTYLEMGNTAEAIAAYQTALRRNPHCSVALLGLAWIYATNEDAAYRDSGEAVGLAERARVELGGDHPKVLDTLAVACAAAGRFEEALSLGRRAMHSTTSARAKAELAARLDLYASRRAYFGGTPSTGQP